MPISYNQNIVMSSGRKHVTHCTTGSRHRAQAHAFALLVCNPIYIHIYVYLARR